LFSIRNACDERAFPFEPKNQLTSKHDNTSKHSRVSRLQQLWRQQKPRQTLCAHESISSAKGSDTNHLHSTARNRDHSHFLCLPAEMRNAIYRFTIGSNTVHIIEHMDYLDGLQTQVALLRVCRQIYYEAIPLVLGLRQLVLGNYKVAGHGRRMKKVLDRMLKCPLSAYIGAMAFMIEKESAVVAGKKIKLCANLISMAKKL
jgi:hypothetical protein